MFFFIFLFLLKATIVQKNTSDFVSLKNYIPEHIADENSILNIKKCYIHQSLFSYFYLNKNQTLKKCIKETTLKNKIK